MYYIARERAKVQRDIMTLIVDSYDHAKLSLPKYPMSRTPKRTVFEATRRNLIELVICLTLRIPKNFLPYVSKCLNSCYLLLYGYKFVSVHLGEVPRPMQMKAW